MNKKSAKASWHWLDVGCRETPHPPMPEERLASFNELYEAVGEELKEPHRLPTNQQMNKDVKWLNSQRNQFIHFVPQRLSLEVSGMPRIVRNCSEVIEHLAIKHPTFWHSVGEPEASLCLERVAKALSTLRTNVDEWEKQVMDSRRRAAFHEAGHAVVAWALRHNVGRMRLLGEGSGKTDIKHPEGRDPIEKAMIAVAGGLAADRSGIEAAHDLETISDQAALVNYLDEYDPELTEKDREPERGRVLEDTHALVAEHATVVEALAGALLVAGELSRKEVCEILGQPPLLELRSRARGERAFLPRTGSLPPR